MRKDETSLKRKGKMGFSGDLQKSIAQTGKKGKVRRPGEEKAS